MNINWGIDVSLICKLCNSILCLFKSCFVLELLYYYFKSMCKWNYKKFGKMEGLKGRNLKIIIIWGWFILFFWK